MAMWFVYMRLSGLDCLIEV